MPVPTSSPQDTAAVIAVLAAVVIGWAVIHWRAALTVILLAVLAFVVYGMTIGFEEVSSLLSVHHR